MPTFTSEWVRLRHYLGITLLALPVLLAGLSREVGSANTNIAIPKACVSAHSTQQGFLFFGGGAQVSVVAQPGCSWSAASSVEWITFRAGSSGSGSGNFIFDVARNTTPQERTGTITVGGAAPITIAQQACLSTRSVPSFKQNSGLWASDRYDHLIDFADANGSYKGKAPTIANFGCALTSMVMVIRSYGVTVGADGKDVNPRNLNEWMKGNGGFAGEGNLDWSKIGKYTNHQVEYSGGGAGATADIGPHLRADVQPIVSVKNNSHWVVPTQSCGDSTLINDPGHTDRTTLHHLAYGGTISQIRLFKRGNNLPVKSLTVIAKSPVELVITDPLGRRAGFNPITNIEHREIPNGSYSRDRFAALELPNDNEPPPFIEPIKSVHLMNPADGEYRISVVGTGTGGYAIDVVAVDQRGVEVTKTIAGTASTGSSATYALRYDTSSGTLDGNVLLSAISGRVVNADGLGIGGATVTVSGSQSATTLTDASGNYSFINLSPGGTYTVTASMTGLTFSPQSRIFDNLSGDQTAYFVTPAQANVSDTTPFFVSQHYRDFLGREPDPPGLAFWGNEISSCGTNTQCVEVKRINVSAAFFFSIEFQQTGFLVHRLYKVSYGRMPRLSEFQSDTQEMARGVVVGASGWEDLLKIRQRSFASTWIQRATFKAIYDSKSDAQYVDALFANAGITPLQDDRDALINGLISGTETRATVLRKVAENEVISGREFNSAFVLMQYFGYLRRNPDDAPDLNLDGFNFWLRKLNDFNGNFVQAEMVKAFLSSVEYRGRFGMP